MNLNPKLLKQCVELRNRLIETGKAMKGLESAVKKMDLDTLTAAIQQANKACLPQCEIYSRAQKLHGQLKEYALLSFKNTVVLTPIYQIHSSASQCAYFSRTCSS